MQDDNRETEIEIKVLSDYEKEEIFFVRWLTFIVSTVIIIFICMIFFNLNPETAFTIIVLNIFIPPVIYFRKRIGAYINEKIIYWWSMINGRVP